MPFPKELSSFFLLAAGKCGEGPRHIHIHIHSLSLARSHARSPPQKALNSSHVSTATHFPPPERGRGRQKSESPSAPKRHFGKFDCKLNSRHFFPHPQHYHQFSSNTTTTFLLLLPFPHQLAPLNEPSHHSSGGASAAGGAAGGIQVWFVLLEKAKVANPGEYARLRQAGVANQDHPHLLRRDLSAREAYRRLAANMSRGHVPLRLRVAADRVVVAYIRRHSLQSSSAKSHPALSNSLPRSLLRATYTAGSMAGLGLAMAVAGLSLGLLTGFLLWKRRIGLPPYADLSPDS